jgi:hypothetical protein
MTSGQVLDRPSRPHSDIFISYRRSEASYIAGWLRDTLADQFGEHQVFLDVDSIRPSTDFMSVIVDALRRCRLVLVIIGPHWLALDEHGKRRIDDPADPVRIEIEIALKSATRVLPVLIDDARVPDVDELPLSIRDLRKLNHTAVRHDSARDDIMRLVDTVGELLGSPADARQHELREARVLAFGEQLRPRTTASSETDRSAVQLNRLARQLQSSYTEYVRQSLDGDNAVRIPLELALMPQETFRPADWLLPEPRGLNTPASANASFLEIFEISSADGDGLLLLGGPGAGKTTLLFECAAELTRRSLTAGSQPVPVYVSLSTWSASRQTLTDWLVTQLDLLYQVPVELAHYWIQTGEVLFLLDGLDEIRDPSTRTSCAKAINQYLRFGRQVLVPTIVVSRKAEYHQLGCRLQLAAAVEVCPLEPVSVLRRMRAAGSRGRSVIAAVEADDTLQDLLRSPLLLSMFLIADMDLATTTEAIDRDRARPLAQLLIGRYVEKRFLLERVQGNGRNRYGSDSTQRWLRAMARHLEGANETIFFLDAPRVDWLKRTGLRRIVLTAPSLAWGVSMGLAIASAIALSQPFGPPTESAPLATLVAFGVVGLTAGLIPSISFRLRALVWTTLGAVAALLEHLRAELESAAAVLIASLLYAVFAGSLGEIAIRLVGGELQLVENLKWSSQAAGRGLRRSLVAGALFGVVYEVPNWLGSGEPPGRAVFLGVTFGLVIGLVFGLTVGLRPGLGFRSVPIRLRPNEGVRRSLIIGSLATLVGTIVVGLTFFLSGLVISPAHGLVRAVAWGPTIGILWGLTTGLGAVLQYWTLRALLCVEQSAPMTYGRWLEYLVDLRILYFGVGGGYVFIHRAVQEHFANIEGRAVAS